MASQYVVTIPEDVKLVLTMNPYGVILDSEEAAPDADPKTFSTFEFVRNFLLQQVLGDPAWAASMDLMYMAMDIRGKFRGKKPGEQVTLDQGEHNGIMERLKTPHESKRINPLIGVHLGSFWDAVKKAEEKKAA